MTDAIVADQDRQLDALGHAEQVVAPGARRRVNRRRVVMFPISFALVAGLWEAYKAIGPEQGGKVLGWKLLPKTGDREMPHIWDMVSRLGSPEVRGGADDIWVVVLKAMGYSLWLAIIAVLIGCAIGLGLAMLMARFKVVERALSPYLIVSQTIPIIALAPLVVGILANVSKDLGAKKWIAVVALGAFLAFFPIAVGALRGLQSAAPAAAELMDSYASGWWQRFTKLLLPSSVPFLAPALRVAGASAVVGVIVSEISVGQRGGVGRLILSYSQEASTDPPKLFTAVFGAAGLGLLMAGLVVLAERIMMRNRPVEQPL